MTWVRAPGLHSFNVIFPLVFTCSFNMVDHYAPSESSHPRVPHYQSQEHNLKNTVYCSQPLHKLHEKVNKAMLIWAQIAKEKPPKSGADPLGLQSFFYFLIFLLCLFSFNYCS